jgi:hypothetical protein
VPIDPEEMANKELNFESGDIWGTSDLERVIPVELREDELDEETPLGICSFRPKCY